MHRKYPWDIYLTNRKWICGYWLRRSPIPCGN